MTTLTKLGLAISIASVTLVGCGGGSDSGSGTNGGNGTVVSEKAYPWVIIQKNYDSQGKGVIQRIDRSTVGNILYQKDPIRIVGGQNTFTYADTYYFAPDFFFTQPATNTKYGKPISLISSLKDTSWTVSPYNDAKTKYITSTLTYQINDLSNKPVVSVKGSALAGENLSVSYRFPSGAKCRGIDALTSQINVGNSDIYYTFDASAKTGYTSLNLWQMATLRDNNINPNSVEILDEEISPKKLPVRLISSQVNDDFYLATLYNGQVYKLTAILEGTTKLGIQDYCFDYNDIAADYLTEVAQSNFKARPAPRLALPIEQQASPLTNQAPVTIRGSDIKDALLKSAQ
ncbi:MAG: hypothetical protein Q4P13_06785 [Psychrobacter sp.]|nr:hypothetical protein [Psychrobacter sp.]